MTYEEVIMMLEVDATNATGALMEVPTERQRELLNKKIEAYDMAQVASRKQIAQKIDIVDWSDRYEDALIEERCPVCSAHVDWSDNYCSECGQKLER